MNKGFVHYFRQAFKCAVSTIWKSKGRGVISSFVYFFISLFGNASIVLSPMMALADVRMGKIAKNEKVIDIPQSFSKASQKPLWTFVVAILLEILIYLGGFLLLTVIAGAIFGVGMVIASTVGASTVIYIVFAAPGLIIYSIYTIIMLIMFAPTAYVIDTNPNVPAGEVIAICFSSLKGHGKTTTFLLNFVPMAIQSCIAGLFGGIMALISLIVDAKIMAPVLIIVGCVSLAGMMLSIPIFSMTRSIALNQLYGDIALDPVNANKRTAGINIRKISGAKIDREEVADNLSALFDDAVVERTAEPDELQRKHKNKNIRPVNKQAKPQPQHRTTVKVAEEPVTPVEEEFEDLDYPEEKDEPRYESFEAVEEKQPTATNTNAQQQAQQAAQHDAQQAAQQAAQRATEQAAQRATEQAAQQAAQREAEQAQQVAQQQPNPAANPYVQQQAQQQPQPAANPYAQQQAQQQPQPAANPYAQQTAQQQPNPASNPYAQQQAPRPNPYAQQGNPYAQQSQPQSNPYAQQQAPRPNPYAQQGNPYAQQGQPQSNPYAQQQAQRPNPYAQQGNPYAQQGQPQANPYAQQQAQRPNPYAQQGNPYAQQGQPQANPYAQQAQRPNPYANPYAQQGNPYAQQGQPRPNPYAQPNSNPAQGGNGTNGNGGTNV